MRILADENVGGLLISALRSADHDVSSVSGTAPGSNDSAVLALAIKERRIVLTLDKGFGELAVKNAVAGLVGVILVRVRAKDRRTRGHIVLSALESRDDWAGNFSVVENARIRMTPLPEAAG